MHSACFVLLSALLPFASSSTAFEAPITKLKHDEMACVHSLGHSAFIAQTWRNGGYDMNGQVNIVNARAHGFKRVDGVFQTCFEDSWTEQCDTSSNQMEQAISELAQDGAKVDTMWIYIDENDWTMDMNVNRAALSSMVFKAKARGQKVGIGADKVTFEGLFGSDYTAHSSVPLWWTLKNGKADFNDFVPFNGWTSPALHDFQNMEESSCGIIHGASVSYYA